MQNALSSYELSNWIPKKISEYIIHKILNYALQKEMMGYI